jgi:hypothetical protein
MQSRVSRERLYTVSIIRKMFAVASFEQGIEFRTLNIDDRLLLRRDSPAPSAFNVCTCSVSERCPDSSWSGGHIFCKNGNNCTKDSIVWSVPGLKRSCSAGEINMLSDLRCFFNQTCLDMLLSMYNVDMPNRPSLPAATRAIVALNISHLSSFSSEEQMDPMFNKLFVEKWELKPDFIGYYSICAPLVCTYTINRKMDIVYIFTAVIGLLGGMTVILRLLVPVTVRLAHSIIFRWKTSVSNIDDQESENHPGKN